MPTPSTPEASARAILDIFRIMGFGSGATLEKDQVKMQFAVNVGEAADFNSGLEYGVNLGWLELPSASTIKLGVAGAAENAKTTKISNRGGPSV